MGIVNNVSGDAAYFDDITCCPINLLDQYFSNPSLDYKNEFKENIRFDQYQNSHSKFVTYAPPIANLNSITGRETEISEISDKLLNYISPIAINGIRGIGKTSIVKEVISKTIDAFDHIGWITLTGNEFEESFINQIVAKGNNSNGQDTIELISYDKTLNFLNDLQGTKLLIIENIKSPDISKVNQLRQKLIGWKIIITSYTSLENLENFYFIKIDSLSIEAAREMFLAIFQHEDINTIDKIIKKIGFHTLTIEIIAKSCKYWGADYTLEELYEKFEKSGLQELEDFDADIYIDHSIETLTGLIPYYELLFDISNINSNEANILMSLSILLSGSVPSSFIRHAVGLSETRFQMKEFKNALKKIDDLGFISLNEDTIIMHEVTQYFIQYKLNPNVSKCSKLIVAIGREIQYNILNSPVSNLYILPHSEKVIDLLKKDYNETMAILQLSIVHAFQILSLYKKSFEHIEEISLFFINLLPKNDQSIFKRNYHLMYAAILKHMQTTSTSNKAIEHIKIAKDLSYKIYSKYSPEVADCYGELGYHYLIKENLVNARIHFNKAFKIHLLMGELTCKESYLLLVEE